MHTQGAQVTQALTAACPRRRKAVEKYWTAALRAYANAFTHWYSIGSKLQQATSAFEPAGRHISLKRLDYK